MTASFERAVRGCAPLFREVSHPRSATAAVQDAWERKIGRVAVAEPVVV